MGYFEKELKTKLRKFIMRTINEYLRNTANATQVQTLMESGDFVKSHMEGVRHYSDKWHLMDKCIKTALKGQTDQDIYLEFGVYMGKSINYIADRVGNNAVYGFDSFEGLPSFWRDGFDKGTFKVDKLPKVRKNVKLVKGWFSDTLKDFDCSGKRIAMIHVDCDLYESTKCIFEMLSPHIRPGTVIVFDELYNYPGWKDGEYKALCEWAEKSGYGYRWLGYVGNDEQCALVVES